jgi:glycine/D-amino acid oxidase-like deaminating enzyme
MTSWYKSSCHIKTSLWGKTANDLPNMSALQGDLKADILVIGAGFCGLSTALHLAEQGIDVAIVDAHEPGWGASGRNGGQVIPGLKIFPDEIASRFGSERGEEISKTVGAAPKMVFDLIKKYKIDCDLLKTGWIQLAKGPVGLRTTETHVQQWGDRNVSVKALSREDVVEKVGTPSYAGGLLVDLGGNIHPLQYARGLA